MIEVHELTRRYGRHAAVDGVSFTARPGLVTGFLGPNGAGKSTTMRMIAGLSRPTSGRVLIGGRDRFARRRWTGETDGMSTGRAVGALLDPAAIDGARRGADHLRWMAHSHGIDTRCIGEVLDQVGLGRAGSARVSTYSLGMRQRLGIAGALLGDPPVLLFDEPVNGLDPDGILWFRQLCRRLAGEGRTVFLSSHLMGEVALTADHLVVIDAGRIVADAPVADITSAQSGHRLRVSTESPTELADGLRAIGATVQVEATGAGRLEVRGVDASTVGRTAARLGLVLLELTSAESTLEEAFFELTRPASDPLPPIRTHAMTGGPT